MDQCPENFLPCPPIQQTGVVAFRFVGSQHEFCIITGRRSGRWGIPKGRVGSCTSIQEAALCEAWQEAGLSGTIFGDPLGNYPYRKKGKNHEVIVWLMHVESSWQSWKESNQRTRQWATLGQALKLIEQPHVNQFLTLASERLDRAIHGERPLLPELRLSALGINLEINART